MDSNSNSMTGAGRKVRSCDWLLSIAQARPGQLLPWDTLVPLCSVKSEATSLPPAPERDLLPFPTVLCPSCASGLTESNYLTICSARMTKLSQQSDSGQFKQLEDSVNPEDFTRVNLRSEVIGSDCEAVTASRGTSTTHAVHASILCLVPGI